MANGGIPKFYEFKDDVDDWEVYSERLEQHFVANNVKAEEIKVAVLPSSISASTFTLIKNLCYPSPPQTKKFQELSQLLNHQFSAAKSVWRERIKFYELSQGTRSISEWYAAVRGMATKCNFGTDLPKILKDKFVTGLSPGKVLDRLCEEEESATLENLYALAMKKEQSTIMGPFDFTLGAYGVCPLCSVTFYFTLRAISFTFDFVRGGASEHARFAPCLKGEHFERSLNVNTVLT
ncbi:hypothetical protein NQ317_003833 [Molorchus minor]|uniref:Retrotransposon gag domain-containing protein n=1 Tax=Molorchus minor TaxID=1323400 RepID=A0ABQ9JDH8_9CUCU|nr:hypothetical protein NQ317_003833 [Molorchus minor]